MTYIKTKEGTVYRVNDPEYWKDCEVLSNKEGELLYRKQHKETLKRLIRPGDTVYTKLDHVSRSGMQRHISLYIVCRAKKGQPARILNITNQAAIAIDRKVSDAGGIIVNGCGMDMGFDLVYNLGRSLWPKGTTKKTDGGYSLRHEWL